MRIRRTSTASLPAAEREELAQILREHRAQRGQFTARFFSDEGDTMAWPLLFGLAAAVGLGACIVEDVPSSLAETFEFGVASGVSSLLRRPEQLGLVASVLVLVWSVRSFLRGHRRCGWAATSFGAARVFGDRLRLMRYADVARAERRFVRARRGFWVLELHDQRGGRLVTYATPLMDAMLAGVRTAAPDAAIDDERQRQAGS
jgi:hypothetical protein